MKDMAAKILTWKLLLDIKRFVFEATSRRDVSSVAEK